MTNITFTQFSKWYFALWFYIVINTKGKEIKKLAHFIIKKMAQKKKKIELP